MAEETKQKALERHPVFLLGDRVEREGVVVVDDITSQPLGVMLHLEFNPIPETSYPEQGAREMLNKRE